MVIEFTHFYPSIVIIYRLIITFIITSWKIMERIDCYRSDEIHYMEILKKKLSLRRSIEEMGEDYEWK